MVLWKSQDAANATQGTPIGSWEVSRVVIDSRAVRPGDLFVAIEGERFDGHSFVPQALEQGAAAVLVTRGKQGDVRQALVVEDTLKALEALAVAARTRTQAKIAAITGSVGKTSAKEALKLALSSQGSVHATQGNYNNHIGVPLTLANMQQDTDYAIIEMGMNHAGEIAPLSRMARPHAALITAVEAVHIEFFNSVEEIAAAKCEIFQGLEPGGTLLLPGDNRYFERMHSWASAYGIRDIRSFGTGDSAYYQMITTNMEGLGMTIEAQIGSTSMTYRLGATGEHWATMSAGVLGMVDALRADVRVSAEALQRFREPEGRGRLHRITRADGEAYLIDDSYNASPASLRAAIAKLAGIQQGLSPTGHTIAVLGDMLELGKDGPEMHRSLAGPLAEAGVDQVCVCGELMAELYDALPPAMRGVQADTIQALKQKLATRIQAGDIVLVKGSHGSHIYEIADWLREETTHSDEEDISNAL